MATEFTKGFRIKGASLAEGLALLGAQVDWIQPEVNVTATAYLGHKLAALADELAASHLFEEEVSPTLRALKDEPLWTVVTTRISQAEAARRQDGRSTDRSAFLLDLWLAPFLGAVLGRVRQGSSAMYQRLLQVPAVEEYSYTPGSAPPAAVSMREYAERKSHWEMATVSGRACPAAMQWEPGALELARVAKLIEPIPARATQLAKIRAVRQFCDQAREAARSDLPPDKWVAKATELLANPDSRLTASFETERTKMLSGLLPPSSFTKAALLPLWRHAQKGL